jgi:hypothetical protein
VEGEPLPTLACRPLLTSLSFQLKDPIDRNPPDSLPQRIASMGDFTQFAEKLEPMDSVETVFPIEPPPDFIHIIVQVPETGE